MRIIATALVVLTLVAVEFTVSHQSSSSQLKVIHSGLFSHSAKESPQAQGIERRRRQLSSDIKKVTSSTLEQSQGIGRQRRQTQPQADNQETGEPTIQGGEDEDDVARQRRDHVKGVS